MYGGVFVVVLLAGAVVFIVCGIELRVVTDWPGVGDVKDTGFVIVVFLVVVDNKALVNRVDNLFSTVDEWTSVVLNMDKEVLSGGGEETRMFWEIDVLFPSVDVGFSVEL